MLPPTLACWRIRIELAAGGEGGGLDVGWSLDVEIGWFCD